MKEEIVLPTIKVNTDAIRKYEADVQNIQRATSSILERFEQAKNSIDWEIKSSSNVNSRLNTISNEIREESSALNNYCTYLNNAVREYDYLNLAISLKWNGSNSNKYGLEAILTPLTKCSGKGNNKNDFEKLLSTYKSFNDLYVDTIPKGYRKQVEKTLKYFAKKGNIPLGDVLNARDLLNDLANKSDLVDLSEDIMKLLDIKAWDFDTVIDGVTDNTLENHLKYGLVNEGAIKAKGILETIKLVKDPNGYIQEYDKKYMKQAEEMLMSGDILGSISSLTGDFVQTVGKGTVDVCCKAISDTVDDYVGHLTGGLFSLSSINGLCEDITEDLFGCRISGGTLFNGATQIISDSVDFLVDDVLIKGSSNIQKGIIKGGELIAEGIGNAVSSTIDVVKSGLSIFGI